MSDTTPNTPQIEEVPLDLGFDTIRSLITLRAKEQLSPESYSILDECIGSNNLPDIFKGLGQAIFNEWLISILRDVVEEPIPTRELTIGADTYHVPYPDEYLNAEYEYCKAEQDAFDTTILNCEDPNDARSALIAKRKEFYESWINVLSKDKVSDDDS